MPPRGDAARSALLEAAVEEFGPKGFDAASTRAIADRANQNIAAINYHFGSKEGLYLAVADAIASFGGQVLLPIVDEARTYLDGKAHNHADSEAYLARLLTALARVVVGTPAMNGAALFIMREQAQPSAAFETLFQRLMRPLHETVTRLVALRRDLDPAETEAILRAHALISQIMGFRVGRGVLLKRTGWEPATHPLPEHVDRVLKIIVEHGLAAVASGLAPTRHP